MPVTWTIHLSPEAAKRLRALPRDHQQTISRAIDRMQSDPFQGDVQPLKGRKWQGRYRKRVGRYRLIFIPYHRERIAEISAFC
jgi:mRNA-degrading endonuclease RelE of RelBE toxin-antitoxin system